MCSAKKSYHQKLKQKLKNKNYKQIESKDRGKAKTGGKQRKQRQAHLIRESKDRHI
jgi:hypothetical protein